MTQVKSEMFAVEHIRISSESQRSAGSSKAQYPGLMQASPRRYEAAIRNARRITKRRAKTVSLQRARSGALLQITGKRRNALQYDIGNPVCTENVVRFDLLTESPNVGDDACAAMLSPDAVRLAI